MLDAVRNVDCIAGMSELEAGLVDLVFADPPFNIGYEYDTYDDRKPVEQYLEWSARWMEGVKRVLKDDGTFWLAIGDEYAAELKVLATRELGFHCRSWVIWYYTFGVHCSQKFTRSHAHLFHFVKDKKRFTFNADVIRVPSARQLVYADKRAAVGGRTPDDTWMAPAALPPDTPTFDGFVLRPQDIPDRFPPHSDTWYFSRVAGTFGERRGWHGCQMPEQLLGRIIRVSSNQGDVVLDPFGGSGTTLAVAKKLRRHYLGFELSNEYCERIRERLADVNPDDELVGPANAAVSAPKTSKGRAVPRLSASTSSTSRTQNRPTPSVGHPSDTKKSRLGLDNALVKAFLETHEGFSVDRLIADREFNSRFAERCERMRIPGNICDWNRRLLNLRKAKAIKYNYDVRRTILRFSALESVIHASEIAWRALSQAHDYSLDDILVDPPVASEFDRVAQLISPGASSLQCRWAALTLRKYRGARTHAEDSPIVSLTAPVALSKVSRLDRQGCFRVTLNGRDLFVGFTKSFRGCRLLQPQSLQAVVEIFPLDNFSISAIEVSTEYSNRLSLDRMPGAFWAKRMVLVKQFRPIANIGYRDSQCAPQSMSVA